MIWVYMASLFCTIFILSLVSLTTAELVTSMEQEKVIHNESDIMDELYTEPETTYQTLVDDVQIHHTQYPVLQAIANLYLNKQITFHTC